MCRCRPEQSSNASAGRHLGQMDHDRLTGRNASWRCRIGHRRRKPRMTSRVHGQIGWPEPDVRGPGVREAVVAPGNRLQSHAVGRSSVWKWRPIITVRRCGR